MKIDMHVHTSERSGCSIASEAQQIKAAEDFGLDAIIITDHDICIQQAHIDKLNAKSKIKIFSGIEIRTLDAGEDVLVLGVHVAELDSHEWFYKDLYNFVRERDGYIALCHPYRYIDRITIDVWKYKPDALELHSSNIGTCDEPKIRSLAEELGIGLIANSDSHNVDSIGIYCNEINKACETEKEVIDCLRAGEYKIYRDDKRVDAYNQIVRRREDVIRQMIEQGCTAEEYERKTRHWRGYYDRVKQGKSYEI